MKDSPPNNILSDIRDGKISWNAVNEIDEGKFRVVGMIFKIVIAEGIRIMRQYSVFIKLIISTILISSLIACSSRNTADRTIEISNIASDIYIDKEIRDISIENVDMVDNYTIALKDASKITDLSWANGFSFDIIEIQDMPEEISHIQSAINTSIKTAMTSWIEGKVINADSVDLAVTCHSGRYLSFVNSFSYKSKTIDYINDYITIDMLTGKRIFLSDLVEIDREFAEFLQENPSIVKDAPHPFWQSAPDLSKFSQLEVIEELHKCSNTQEQLIQNGYYSINDSIGSLLFKNSFFLREGMLVIIFEQGGESFITLDTDDIKDYLKVKKW